MLERHLDAIDRGLQVLGDTCPVSASPSETSSGQAVRYRFAGGQELVAEIVRSERAREIIEERVEGTAGTADLVNHRISGRSSWSHEGTGGNRWQACMDSFVHAILSGGRGDGGVPLSRSTLVALLGRIALRENREVHWNEVAGPTGTLIGII